MVSGDYQLTYPESSALAARTPNCRHNFPIGMSTCITDHKSQMEKNKFLVPLRSFGWWKTLPGLH